MKHLSELVGVIGTIDPATVTSEVFSDVIDMSKYDQVMGIALLGNMASDSAATFRAVTCDSGGSNAAAFKTSTATTGGTDNTQIVIEVDNNDLAGGATNADRYIKFGLTATNSGGACAVAVLGRAKYGPSSDGDLGTVTEIETDLD
jgi:hypothetical protein